MEHDLILARSVTYAQRMQKILGRAGIRCRVFRAPRNLTERGCAYVVQVASIDLSPALSALYRENFYPDQIFHYQNGSYREVAM